MSTVVLSSDVGRRQRDAMTKSVLAMMRCWHNVAGLFVIALAGTLVSESRLLASCGDHLELASSSIAVDDLHVSQPPVRPSIPCHGLACRRMPTTPAHVPSPATTATVRQNAVPGESPLIPPPESLFIGEAIPAGELSITAKARLERPPQ